MTMLLNWRVWAAVLVAIILAATHWKAYHLGGATVQTAWDQERLTAQAETIQLMDEARAKEVALQAEKDRLRKAKNVEIAKLNSDLADALERLRNRPSRPGEGNLPSNTGSGPAASCTGAGLYRQDGEFLVRESARADRLRADLTECQAAYSKARDALSR